ncbi:unnamed protein product, partial [Meganyctiphanes norvegica]
KEKLQVHQHKWNLRWLKNHQHYILMTVTYWWKKAKTWNKEKLQVHQHKWNLRWLKNHQHYRLMTVTYWWKKAKTWQPKQIHTLLVCPLPLKCISPEHSPTHQDQVVPLPAKKGN